MEKCIHKYAEVKNEDYGIYIMYECGKCLKRKFELRKCYKKLRIKK